MSNVSKWCISVFISATLTACGSGFEVQIRPASERFGVNNVCCGGGPVFSPRSNLIDNYTFEAGIAGWEDWGSSSVVPQAAHAGGKGLRVSGGIGGRGQEVIYRLKTGATYVLKSYARLGSGSEEAYVGIKYFNTGNSLMGDERVRITGTQFSEYTVRFDVPESVSSAKIYMWKASSAGYADYDDFSLTMVENPVNPPMQRAISNPNNFRPIGPAGSWTLVFDDEFNGSSLNTASWNNGFWFNATTGNELQAYRPENVTLSGGALHLTGENRATTTTWGEPMSYASGAVTTRNKFTFTFGVVESRLRVPKGRGLAPAFWLLPNEKRSPPELTIMELFGHDTRTAHMSYKWMDQNGIPRGQPMSSQAADFSADFHTFTVEWLPETLKYYVDGVLVGMYQGEFVLRDPAFILLNLAIGGSSAGSPDGSTSFPEDYQIDYVRVWQRPL